MPIVRAVYRSGKYGRPILQLKGKIDLVFAREPGVRGQNTNPFEIFDGRNLLPISTYLTIHQRPDVIELDKRMRWLGAGPQGARAGDIVVLPHFSFTDPIDQRYYFGPRYYSEHGSPSVQDGHIPFVLARTTFSGNQLRTIATPAIDREPTQLDVVPLMRRLLRPDLAAVGAATR